MVTKYNISDFELLLWTITRIVVPTLFWTWSELSTEIEFRWNDNSPALSELNQASGKCFNTFLLEHNMKNHMRKTKKDFTVIILLTESSNTSISWRVSQPCSQPANVNEGRRERSVKHTVSFSYNKLLQTRRPMTDLLDSFTDTSDSSIGIF